MGPKKSKTSFPSSNVYHQYLKYLKIVFGDLTLLYWSALIETVKKCIEFFLVCRRCVSLKNTSVIFQLSTLKIFLSDSKNKVFAKMTKNRFQLPVQFRLYSMPVLPVCHEWSVGCGTHLRLLVSWSKRLFSQWMLHWWRVKGRTACKPFPCTQPTTPSMRLDRSQHHFNKTSLRYDPNGNGDSLPAVVACATNCSINYMFAVLHHNTKEGVQPTCHIDRTTAIVWYFVQHLLFSGVSCWTIATRSVKIVPQ